MNLITREIAEMLKINLEEALRVQTMLECEAFDFSECSTATLKRNAKRIWKELMA